MAYTLIEKVFEAKNLVTEVPAQKNYVIPNGETWTITQFGASASDMTVEVEFRYSNDGGSTWTNPFDNTEDVLRCLLLNQNTVVDEITNPMVFTGSGTNVILQISITNFGNAEEVMAWFNGYSGDKPASSSVSVSNFPTTQQVSGTVGVNSIPAITGTVTANISGSISNTAFGCNNGSGVSAVNIQDGGNTITVDGSVSATCSGTVAVTTIKPDGTNIAPSMDVATRKGFVQLTDGSNSASVIATLNSLKTDVSSIAGTTALGVNGAQKIVEAKYDNTTVLNPTYYSTRLTTKATTTITSATAYLTSLVICVSAVGSAMSITVQDKSATPIIVYYIASAVAGTTQPVMVMTPIKMTSGIDIIIGGTTAGTVNVWATYWS